MSSIVLGDDVLRGALGNVRFDKLNEPMHPYPELVEGEGCSSLLFEAETILDICTSYFGNFPKTSRGEHTGCVDTSASEVGTDHAREMIFTR